MLADLISKMIYSHDEKIQMLTSVPDNWTIKETVDYFGVSHRMVNEARNPKRDVGVLALPEKNVASLFQMKLSNMVKLFMKTNSLAFVQEKD